MLRDVSRTIPAAHDAVKENSVFAECKARRTDYSPRRARRTTIFCREDAKSHRCCRVQFSTPARMHFSFLFSRRWRGGRSAPFSPDVQDEENNKNETVDARSAAQTRENVVLRILRILRVLRVKCRSSCPWCPGVR